MVSHISFYLHHLFLVVFQKQFVVLFEMKCFLLTAVSKYCTHFIILISNSNSKRSFGIERIQFVQCGTMQCVYTSISFVADCEIDEPRRFGRCFGSHFKLETKGKLGFKNGGFQSVPVVACRIWSRSCQSAFKSSGRRMIYMTTNKLLTIYRQVLWKFR